jgi:NADH-quinone oxidoreductase subunit F
MNTKVTVGLGSCGIAAGAGKTYEKIKALKNADHLDFELKKTSCIGMCYREPLVEIVDDTGTYLYGDVNEERAIEVIEKHIHQKDPIRDYIVYTDLFDAQENDFLNSQVKIVLRNCGYMDPESIDEYEDRKGYHAIRKIADEKITREAVIETILKS